jgi:hypothetical protein
VTLIGVESKKVASWCQRTSPPMPGCLKIYVVYQRKSDRPRIEQVG